MNNELYHFNKNHDSKTGKFTFSRGGTTGERKKNAKSIQKELNNLETLKSNLDYEKKALRKRIDGTRTTTAQGVETRKSLEKTLRDRNKYYSEAERRVEQITKKAKAAGYSIDSKQKHYTIGKKRVRNSALYGMTMGSLYGYLSSGGSIPAAVAAAGVGSAIGGVYEMSKNHVVYGVNPRSTRVKYKVKDRNR